MSKEESSSVLPQWQPPTPLRQTHNVGLNVMNSLTRSKESFVTMDGGREVRWYMCGPTVYAPSHMGHARTYLGFDIIRRIMELHFGYDVTLVMNITDIDDKIIARSAEQDISHLELSNKFELEFHEDMRALGVAPPTVLTRVTEYMDEIPAYIAQLVDQNLAYEANGSVYFHVEAFEASDGMHYCKLEPEQIHNAALLAEAEGKLSQDFVGDKKSPRDFALWKRSKEGEPSWDSPWGPGRPGWHIECSVMASDVLARLFGGNVQMDIHSGGVDLRFPHHDNEMAQAEAHSGCCQWVNYFVHAGHLDIKGFKMSKSLKNFITIQEALKQNTARQIRLCFLLHKYNARMDYGDSTMSHTLVMEKLFIEFFHNVKAVMRETSTMGDSQKLNEASLIVQAAVMATKRKVDAALRDDFDTPTSLHALADLVRSTNLHLESGQLVSLVIRNAAVFITNMFRVFGLIPDGSTEIGFPMSVDGGAGGDGEEALTPVLNALMDFRASVRDKAKSKDIGGVLQECDAFRDDALPTLGIRLEDKAGGKSVWKLADPADLAREKEQKEAELARRAAEQAAQAAERAAKEALAKLPPIDFMKQLTLSDDTTPTTTTATTAPPKYSRFDETTGLPTHGHDGEALNKNQSKKAKKEFDAQQKKYDKFLKSQAK